MVVPKCNTALRLADAGQLRQERYLELLSGFDSALQQCVCLSVRLAGSAFELYENKQMTGPRSADVEMPRCTGPWVALVHQ